MFLISHRGNFWGKEPLIENQPKQIELMIKKGYGVEFDLHFKDSELFLGHDKPETPITPFWLESLDQRRVYIHCKTVATLQYMNFYYPKMHYFYHDRDAITLTSKKHIWMHPTATADERFKDTSLIWKKYGTIVVLPERYMSFEVACEKFRDYRGICTDNPQKYKEIMNDRE